MDYDLRECLKKLGATSAEARCRKFRKAARRTGLLECYVASWHGRGVFQEMLHIRADRYSDRSEVTGEILGQSEQSLAWKPVEVKRRTLTEGEWQAVVDWVGAAELWELPSRDDATPWMDGEVWAIEGFLEGHYHLVKRHTGSVVDGTGAEVFRLGQRLARVAGLRRFDD